MSLTFTANTKQIIPRGSALGGVKIHQFKITGDGSYGSGGYPITAANMGFDNGLITIIPVGLMGTAAAAGIKLAPQWDSANGKMILYKTIASGAAVEAAAGDPNGLFLEVTAIGY